MSHDVFIEALRDQVNAGVDLVGVGSHSLYDHVLDWTLRLGLIPRRFDADSLGQKKSAIENRLQLYFAMARGVPGLDFCL